MSSDTGTGRAFRSAAVIIGIGTVVALVVGLLAGVLQGDVALGLARYSSPVLTGFVIWAVIAAYRAGERRGDR